MATKEYLTELIDRMNDRSDIILQPGFDSTKTVSWKAAREAEKLNDPQLLPHLKVLISQENDKTRRDKAYFILGHVALNTGDASASSFLIQQIPHEADENVLTSMLLLLIPLVKPKGIDIRPLLDLLSHESWQVRQAAIQALNHHEDESAEDALIKIVKTSPEHYDVLYALGVLRDTGTSRAIASIQQHVNSNKKDIKSLAAAAIAAIKQRKK